MPVYDDEKTEAERLRQVTGIGKEEEAAMEASARSKDNGFYHKDIDNKSADKKSLASAETAGDQVGLGHNPNDNDSGLGRLAGSVAVFRGFFWGSKARKRSTIGGSIVGLLLGGGFFGLSIISGPLQFLKVLDDLKNFHFSSLVDHGNQRSSGILQDIRKLRALKAGAGWERTRLGFIGRQIAPKLEAKLTANGVEFVTSKAGIITDGIRLDPKKYPELKNMEPEEAAQYLKEKYKLKGLPKVIDGKVFIAAEDIGNNPLISRGLTRGILQNLDFNALTARMGSRFLDNMYNLGWHIMTNTRNQKIGETFDKWKQRMNQDQEQAIEQGTENTGVNDATEKPCNSGETTCEQNNQQAASETEDAKSTLGDAEAARSGGFGNQALKDLTKNLTEKLTSKAASGIGGIIATLCIMYGLNKAYPAVKMAEVIIPLIRFAFEYESLGSQVKSGQDTSTQQLGYYSQAFYDNSSDTNDPNASTTWTQAQSQNAEEINAGMSDAPSLGKNGSIPGVPPENALHNISKGSPLSWIDAPGLGQTLGIVCSGLGSFFVGLLGGGPIGAILGTVLGPVITQIPGVGSSIARFASMIVGWMVGAPVTAFPQGAQTGNYLNFGGRLASNAQAVTSGGGALTPAQEAQQSKDEGALQQQQFASNSFADRIFNPWLNGSLLNKLATSINPSIYTNVASITSDITGIFGSLAHSLSSLIARPSYAAGTVNLDSLYGFPAYGFSDADMNNASTADPYQNSINAANLLDSQCTDSNHNPDTSCKIIQQAQQCFGVNISGIKNADGSNQWDVQVGSTPINPYNTDYPTSECSSNDPNWLTIRFFVFDTETMKSLGCYEGDAMSCSELGFANS